MNHVICLLSIASSSAIAWLTHGKRSVALSSLPARIPALFALYFIVATLVKGYFPWTFLKEFSLSL